MVAVVPMTNALATQDGLMEIVAKESVYTLVLGLMRQGATTKRISGRNVAQEDRATAKPGSANAMATSLVVDVDE